MNRITYHTTPLGRVMLAAKGDALADYFQMSLRDAKTRLADMRRVISGWKREAYELGISSRETARMAPLFDV